ncbi:uncharacterized protein LOC143632192 [Bidens hawaiensis]|uniref:uncharacterized protein LOC143632192 n=1 Tax=Bidens hawaiensis TaxID=980011 RepID=UPI00404B0A8C
MVHLNEERLRPDRYENDTKMEDVWYLDNGASNHMTGNRGFFLELNERITGKVRFGDGSCVEIKGNGRYFSKKNQVNKDGFSHWNNFVKATTFKSLASYNPDWCYNRAVCSVDGCLLLLGAVYIKDSKKLEQGQINMGAPCHLERLANTTRYMWIIFLKEKSDAFDMFKKFKALVEKETEKIIKTLRTDRGGEFTSHEFGDFCEANGVIRPLTAPYTPQQNGMVEHRNQTLMEMTRSIMKALQVLIICGGKLPVTQHTLSTGYQPKL